MHWYIQAAKQGHDKAQYYLGQCYAVGKGIEQSWKQAIHYYTLVANQNNVMAQFNLAVCYEEVYKILKRLYV